MSFPNFGEGGAQPQQGNEEQGGYGAPGAPQQQNPMGQQMDPSQQQGQFPGAQQSGPPGSAGPQPGGDSKTTLWYVVMRRVGTWRHALTCGQDG